jgi:cell fate regulator YaaT (PSP1 superfamily)
MSCGSCSTGKTGVPGGCKSNGSCGTGGCGKLHVFDWLSNMALPIGYKAFEGVEIRFKSTRKIFYRNAHALQLFVGDVVAVDTSPGYDVGIVSAVGELAKIQMDRKEGKSDTYDLKKIIRKATEEDIKIWQDAREGEEKTMYRSRILASELKLQMKISDVEYQGDRSKAIFYYTAEDRVDFRELIKKLAEEFKVRVEMKQIGSRQEAGRLGGIGSCGRELCCSTWLTDFRTVSTSAARYQQLSINPQKLAGQCGKLKCCLNYELDMYLETIKDFPDSQTKLATKKGRAFNIKTDIFRGLMWFVYEGTGMNSPIPLEVARVHEIIKMNEEGTKPDDLKDFMKVEVVVHEPDYENVVGQDSLTRFDNQNKRKKKKKTFKKTPAGENKNEASAANKPRQERGPGNNAQKRKPNNRRKPNNNQQKSPDAK